MASSRVACRECKASIYFLKQQKSDGTLGQLNPINAEPSINGNLVIDGFEGTYRFATAEEKKDGVRFLYNSHFMDCTNPGRFRSRDKGSPVVPLPLIDVDHDSNRTVISETSPIETFEEFFSEVRPHLESIMSPSEIETIHTFMGLAYTRGSISAGARIVRLIENIQSHSHKGDDNDNTENEVESKDHR